MHWTKERSKNAVAAKQRIRMERATAEVVIEPIRKIRMPRSKARFRIRIDDFRLGDTLNLSLSELPWRGRFVTADRKQLSTAKICMAIARILNTL